MELRRPPGTQLLHSRRNGRFCLDITGHPQFGLPFGQDRLIPIWVATLALICVAWLTEGFLVRIRAEEPIPSIAQDFIP
jgi:hypothetical protein